MCNYGILSIKKIILVVKMEDLKLYICLFFEKEIGKLFINNSF